ncbi:MAG: hypothetical protein A2743_03770 [Candidatus Taylorbacteria bacterium RIFCSPHIGHO2_01_FULL_43_47]|nr:MAG: hypothetical protein A2743_03770 [Candidatus Taylorbacteria bacterium RIFCSPHIGHO2_01_FULL_43_47]
MKRNRLELIVYRCGGVVGRVYRFVIGREEVNPACLTGWFQYTRKRRVFVRAKRLRCGSRVWEASS